MALSKIIAENINNKVYVHKLVKVAFSLLFIVGLVLTILLIGFSKFVANIQGAPIAWISFVAIAPSIFFVSLICVYRGVFQGYKDMSPTSKSQVIEQIVKLVASDEFGQTFITDTNKDNLDAILSSMNGEYKLFDVAAGEIKERHV